MDQLARSRDASNVLTTPSQYYELLAWNDEWFPTGGMVRLGRTSYPGLAFIIAQSSLAESAVPRSLSCLLPKVSRPPQEASRKAEIHAKHADAHPCQRGRRTCCCWPRRERHLPSPAQAVRLFGPDRWPQRARTGGVKAQPSPNRACEMGQRGVSTDALAELRFRQALSARDGPCGRKIN